MKKMLWLLSIMFCCFSARSLSLPITQASILQSGNQYSAINRLHTPGTRGWFMGSNDSIYTAWGRQWAEYSTYLTKGRWDIGLNVINNGYLSQHWYDNFKVRTSLTNQLLNIQASDTDVFYGLSSFFAPTDDIYTVRYTWLNDKWGGSSDPLHRDANIQIDSAFFNRIPNLSSITLIIIGIFSLLITRRQVMTKRLTTLPVKPLP